MTDRRWLRVASIMALVWAVVVLVGAVALVVAMVATYDRFPFGVAVLAVLAIVHGFCAWRMRRSPPGASRWLTLAGALVWIVLLYAAQVRVSRFGMVLNAAVAVAILADWRRAARRS